MPPKKVKILNKVSVYLIPERIEYNAVSNELWWSEQELDNFRKNYHFSINIISNMKNVDFLEARKILNEIVIGQGATGVSNNSVTLGNADVTAVYMSQDRGATVYCGGLNVSNLPTSDPNVAGQIWSDSGTLKVSSG